MIITVLVVAALVLLILDRVFHKNATSMWAIYRGWLIMIPILLVFVFLGRVAFIIGVLALSILAFREFSTATLRN